MDATRPNESVDLVKKGVRIDIQIMKGSAIWTRGGRGSQFLAEGKASTHAQRKARTHAQEKARTHAQGKVRGRRAGMGRPREGVSYRAVRRDHRAMT